MFIVKGVWLIFRFPCVTTGGKNIPGLGRCTKWTSWHCSDHWMIHVCFGNLRSGQNNQRSLCDSRLRATTSLMAKTANVRQGGRRHKDGQITRTWKTDKTKVNNWGVIVPSLTFHFMTLNIKHISWNLKLCGYHRRKVVGYLSNMPLMFSMWNTSVGCEGAKTFKEFSFINPFWNIKTFLWVQSCRQFYKS